MSSRPPTGSWTSARRAGERAASSSPRARRRRSPRPTSPTRAATFVRSWQRPPPARPRKPLRGERRRGRRHNPRQRHKLGPEGTSCLPGDVSPSVTRRRLYLGPALLLLAACGGATLTTAPGGTSARTLLQLLAPSREPAT